MAEASEHQQQQQYPNLNPYASSNGQTGQSGQSVGQQAQNASNSFMNSKVSAHPLNILWHPNACLPKVV